MRKLVALVLFFLASITALAQQPIASQQPSRDEVLRLMEVLRVKKQMEVVMTGMYAQMAQSFRTTFKKQAPDASEEQLAVFDTVLKEMQAELKVEGLAEELVPIYQRNLSKEDVAAITAFYETHSGQQLLDKMPKISQEAMQAGANYAERVLEPWSKIADVRIKQLMAEAAKKKSEGNR